MIGSFPVALDEVLELFLVALEPAGIQLPSLQAVLHSLQLVTQDVEVLGALDGVPLGESLELWPAQTFHLNQHSKQVLEEAEAGSRGLGLGLGLAFLRDRPRVPHVLDFHQGPGRRQLGYHAKGLDPDVELGRLGRMLGPVLVGLPGWLAGRGRRALFLDIHRY